MNDVRFSIAYKILLLLEKCIAKIKYLLYEKGRFSIFEGSFENNYSKVMKANLEKFSFKPETSYERKLFLELFATHLSYIYKDKKLIRLLDYGGGIGSQAIYLKKIFKKSLEIDVLEQDELVESVRKSINYKKIETDKIRFIKLSDLKTNNYDCTIFNGSLSYINRPLELLKKNNLGELIGISRFPISEEIDSIIKVFDSYGSHIEKIYPANLVNDLNKSFDFLFKDYDNLPKSKSKIRNFKVMSLNLILFRKSQLLNNPSIKSML